MIITTYCRNSKSNIWDIIILIQGGIIVATVETYLTKSYHAIVRGRTSCNNSVCLGKTYFADCYLPWNLYHIYTWLLSFHHKDHTHLDDIAFYSSALWWFCLLCLPQMTDLWNRRKPFIALGIWKQFLNKLILIYMLPEHCKLCSCCITVFSSTLGFRTSSQHCYVISCILHTISWCNFPLMM